MKTLIYTSIYSNLWGTEFGGRDSRKLHYRHSFKNILNLGADKFVCFVSFEEYEELCKLFYNDWGVSREDLEFVVFNLNQTKHIDKIKKLKNVNFMKTFDRCYEIQYNKFFWYDLLENKDHYDKIYWFDAGLSHEGLFPEKYSFGANYERYFTFNLFNWDFLNHLNSKSNEKFILLGKNNQSNFFWSQTIPPKYYKEYDNKIHVVGGFFGGNPKIFEKVKFLFEEKLLELLNNENQLYMEEQILSCIFFNETENFELLFFDDWYKRENHHDNDKIKYFYNLFEI